MMSGILLFALWAGILATGFSEEVRRREFLRTYDLVHKVPFFRDLGTSVIAELARLLKPREYPAGATVVRRGQNGDCMYFIVSGEIEIRADPKPLHLHTGSFFGEIALITGGPRTATAVASKRAVLLLLDIADFRDLAARRPELAQAIHSEAERRQKRMPFATAD
jgi:voltage-gated potassium channel